MICGCFYRAGDVYCYLCTLNNVSFPVLNMTLWKVGRVRVK